LALPSILAKSPSNRRSEGSLEMKVSIQEKIAELESRIVGLESQCEIHFGVAFKRYSGAPTPNVFATDSHWRKM
jgi:hypothetical protein